MITRPSMVWVRAQLQPAFSCPWARYWISISFIDQSVWGPVSCRECYNLSADSACTWPVANRPRWSEMIVTISRWGNNKNRQQHFDHMVRCYINPITIEYTDIEYLYNMWPAPTKPGTRVICDIFNFQYQVNHFKLSFKMTPRSCLHVA